MKYSKSIFFICLLVSLSLLLSSCVNIYKKGVDYSDFPEKDVPIYDDCVVFEFVQDDEEINLSYGTNDDLEDIIEFYQDEFDDEDYTIKYIKEREDEYRIKGYIDDIAFDIEVEEASKDEEEYFDYVVTISTEQVDEEEIEQIEVSQSEELVLTTGSNSTNTEKEIDEKDSDRPSLSLSDISEGFYIKRDDKFYECGYKDNLYSKHCNAFMIPISDMTYDIIEIEKKDTLIARASYIPDFVYIAPVVISGYTYGGMIEWEKEICSLRSIPDYYYSLADTDLFSTFLFKPINDPTKIEKINDQEIGLLESKLVPITKDRVLITKSEGYTDDFLIYLGEENETVKFTYFKGMDALSFTTKADVAVYFHGNLENEDLDSLDTGYASPYETEYVDRAEFHLTDQGYIIIDYVFPSTGMYIIRAKASFDRYFTTIVNVVE